MDDLKIIADFDFVDPEELFETWLDGEGHAGMTGSDATGSAEVGSDFTAWGGYISGSNLELDRPHRIVQSWRTTEFPEDAPDSRVEITFEATPEEGTRMTLVHTNIPAGDGEKYLTGWTDHYIEPMQGYFDFDEDEDYDDD